MGHGLASAHGIQSAPDLLAAMASELLLLLRSLVISELCRCRNLPNYLDDFLLLRVVSLSRQLDISLLALLRLRECVDNEARSCLGSRVRECSGQKCF